MKKVKVYTVYKNGKKIAETYARSPQEAKANTDCWGIGWPVTVSRGKAIK